MLITMAWTSGRQLQTLLCSGICFFLFLFWTWLSLGCLRHMDHLLCYLFFSIFSCYINLNINDKGIDVGKQRKSQREFILHKTFHTRSPNSEISYQMVSYREKTIIYGEYLCPLERPVGKKSYHWAHISVFTFFTWWARQTLKNTGKNTVIGSLEWLVINQYETM